MQIERVRADILKEKQRKYHPGGAQRGSAGQRGAGLVMQLKESREVSGELLSVTTFSYQQFISITKKSEKTPHLAERDGTCTAGYS